MPADVTATARGSRVRAFTLIEVLFALAATAVILTALATAMPAMLRAREAAQARLARATTIDAVLARIERELTTARPEPFEVTAMPSALRFTGGDEPGTRIGYLVRDGALAREQAPRFAAEDAAPAAPTSLLDGVTGFEVRIFDGVEWKRAWHADRPPRAVTVRLTFADGDAAETTVVVPIGRARVG